MRAPLGMDHELDAIERKRALAYALRMRMMQGADPDRVVGGVLMPNLSGISNAMQAHGAQRELDALDREQAGVMGRHEARVADAMRGVAKLSDPFAQVDDEADILARAQVAGIDTSGIQKQRQGARMLQGMLGPNFGFGPPAGGPATPAAAPTSSGAPNFGFVAPARPSSQGPQTGPNPAAGDPLSGLSDAQLLVLSSVDSPFQKLAENVAKSRKFDVKDGVLLQNGVPVPRDHPLVRDMQAAKVEVAGLIKEAEKQAEARYAGPIADAQEGAKAKRDVIEVKINGRPTQMTREQAAAYFNGAPSSSAGQRFTGNFTNAPIEEVEAAIRDARAAPAAPAAAPRIPGFGVGQTPGEIAGEQEAARQGQQTIGERERAMRVPRWNSDTNQFVTASDQPPGVAVTPEGAKGKRPSDGMLETLAKNDVTITKISDAIREAGANPQAFGALNYLPDAVRQRGVPLVGDPKGVKARAMVADIAGQKIHDRSGAAVSIGEAERLRPYVPNPTDEASVVVEKLGLLQREYDLMQQELRSGLGIADVVKAKGAKRVKWGDL